MDTRVSVALARLESRLAEVDQEKEKKMALMRETLIASVKALRIEMAEGEKEKKDEEDEKKLETAQEASTAASTCIGDSTGSGASLSPAYRCLSQEACVPGGRPDDDPFGPGRCGCCRKVIACLFGCACIAAIIV